MENIIAEILLIFFVFGFYAIVILIPAVFFFWLIKLYLFNFFLSVEDKKKKQDFLIKLGLLMFCVCVIGFLKEQSTDLFYFIERADNRPESFTIEQSSVDQKTFHANGKKEYVILSNTGK